MEKIEVCQTCFDDSNIKENEVKIVSPSECVICPDVREEENFKMVTDGLGKLKNYIQNLEAKNIRYKKTLESFGFSFKLCWLCGVTTEITQHHLKPIKIHGKNNYKIPLCKEDHAFIEEIKIVIEIMRKEKRLSVTRFKQLVKIMDNIETPTRKVKNNLENLKVKSEFTNSIGKIINL